MLKGRKLRCEPVGRSWGRVVARCTLNKHDVGCTLIAAGAAVEWPEYRVRYGLAKCGGGDD